MNTMFILGITRPRWEIDAGPGGGRLPKTRWRGVGEHETRPVPWQDPNATYNEYYKKYNPFPIGIGLNILCIIAFGLLFVLVNKNIPIKASITNDKLLIFCWCLLFMSPPLLNFIHLLYLHTWFNLCTGISFIFLQYLLLYNSLSKIKIWHAKI